MPDGNIYVVIDEMDLGGGASTLDGLTDVVITAAASGDILRHNGTNWVDAVGTSHFQPVDSDLTAIAALSTTAHGRSFLTASDPAAGLALVTPTITQTALGTSYTPAQLTMRAVHAERTQGMIPSAPPHAVLVEEFTNASIFTTRYNTWNESPFGAVTSETLAFNSLTVTGGASGSYRSYRAQTQLLSPSGVFAAVRVDPGWVGAGDGAYVTAGFMQDGSGGDYVQVGWRLDLGIIQIESKTGSGNINGGASPVGIGSVAGPTTDTGPIWIGLILGWPVATAVMSSDGKNWTVLGDCQLTRTVGLTTPAAWATFKPGFRLGALSNNNVAKVSGFRTGYAGLIGHLNHRVVTLTDGTPLKRNGKYYVTLTVPHGNGTFFGQHLAVASFDPNTYAIELVRHLHVSWNGIIGSASVGAIVYDPATAMWDLVASTWGIGDQTTGIDLIWGTTYEDLLSSGSSLIPCTTITVGSNSMYDAAPRLENGVWKVAVIETTVRTNWTGPQHQARLLTGPSLNALTLVASDSTEADGTQWAKIGGNWYILAGTTTGFIAWDANLANKTALPSWTTNVPTGLLTFGGFTAHPTTLVVDDGYRTRYVGICYDASTHVGSEIGTRGGMIVIEADEKPAGQEFAPKLYPQYIGC